MFWLKIPYFDGHRKFQSWAKFWLKILHFLGHRKSESLAMFWLRFPCSITKPVIPDPKLALLKKFLRPTKRMILDQNLTRAQRFSGNLVPRFPVNIPPWYVKTLCGSVSWAGVQVLSPLRCYFWAKIPYKLWSHCQEDWYLSRLQVASSEWK